MTERRLQPDPKLLAAARLVENLATKLPHARHHIHQQINTIDGWRATGETDIKVQHTNELTPVETAAQQRLNLWQQLTDLETQARHLATIAANACNNADHITGTRIETPRCTGGFGRDGAIQWGRPDCQDIRGRGELCIACYHRERRWRQEHQLPNRPTEDTMC